MKTAVFHYTAPYYNKRCIMTVLFFICSRLSTTLLLQAGTNDSTGFHYTPVVEFEVRFQKTREITRVKKNHVSDNAMYRVRGQNF